MNTNTPAEQFQVDLGKLQALKYALSRAENDLVSVNDQIRRQRYFSAFHAYRGAKSAFETIHGVQVD